MGPATISPSLPHHSYRVQEVPDKRRCLPRCGRGLKAAEKKRGVWESRDTERGMIKNKKKTWGRGRNEPGGTESREGRNEKGRGERKKEKSLRQEKR